MYNYYCTNCGFSSSQTNNLIKTNRQGCTSCGRSNFKCPRCGLLMKSRKNPTIIPNNVVQNNPSIVKDGTYEKGVKTGRNIKINKK